MLKVRLQGTVKGYTVVSRKLLEQHPKIRVSWKYLKPLCK